MATIGKTELTAKVLENYSKDNVSKAQMSEIVGLVFDEIKKAVTAGNNVTVVKFGKFSKTHRHATTRKTPHGTSVDIPERDVPVFKCSNDWKNECNS